MTMSDGDKIKSGGIWQDLKENKNAYLMAYAACWGGMLFGWTTGMIGGILPRESFKHSFGLDQNPEKYANVTGTIVAILQGGSFVGALATAHLSDHYGRRSSLFIGSAFYLLGSVLQVIPTVITSTPSAALDVLNIGRGICGIGVGIISTVVPMYISESSPKHVRGRLTGMYQLFNVTGICLSFWVNYILLKCYGDNPDLPRQWQIAFTLQIPPGVLLVHYMTSQDESPRWLAEKGRLEETKRVLARLRGLPVDDPSIKKELDAIRKDVEGRSKVSLMQQLQEATSSPKMLYRCSIPVILMAFQQLTGVNVINYYSPVIFAQLGVKSASASLLGTGIYGIVKIITTTIALVAGVEQWGRKAMLVWGGLGQASCMLFIGTSIMLNRNDDGDTVSYFAVATLYLYVISFSFGWSVAPWPAMSESVPNHLRSLTMSLGLMSLWLFNFGISKVAPLLLNSIKEGTYYLFAGGTLIGVLWALFGYPETGGYAIEEIHTLFEHVIRQSVHDIRYIFSGAPQRGHSMPASISSSMEEDGEEARLLQEDSPSSYA